MMKNLKQLILQLIILTLAINSLSAQCINDNDAIPFTFDKKNYEVITVKKNWYDAVECAQERGGYLVHINSEEEDKAVLAGIMDSAGVLRLGVGVDIEDLRTAATILDYGGLGIEVVGLTLIPIQPEFGIPISQGGAYISATGSGINATLDLIEGDYNGAIINATGIGLGKATNKGLDKLLKGKKNEMPRELLKTNQSVKRNVTGKAIDKKLDEKKDEDNE